jgi:hypothetical protein
MAFGFGLPVIASHVGGLPDDVNALTEAMARSVYESAIRAQVNICSFATSRCEVLDRGSP